MEHFAQGIVAGFAVSAIIPFMYYLNKATLGTLFVVNKAIGKAIVRVIIPPPSEIEYVPMKHTCNDDDCIIVYCSCDICEHYSCYECEKKELNP